MAQLGGNGEVLPSATTIIYSIYNVKAPFEGNEVIQGAYHDRLVTAPGIGLFCEREGADITRTKLVFSTMIGRQKSKKVDFVGIAREEVVWGKSRGGYEDQAIWHTADEITIINTGKNSIPIGSNVWITPCTSVDMGKKYLADNVMLGGKVAFRPNNLIPIITSQPIQDTGDDAFLAANKYMENIKAIIAKAEQAHLASESNDRDETLKAARLIYNAGINYMYGPGTLSTFIGTATSNGESGKNLNIVLKPGAV